MAARKSSLVNNNTIINNPDGEVFERSWSENYQ